jgi:two-component system OmpR family response regulator
VVVIDLDLPHQEGLSVTRALAGRSQPPRVVAMNVFGADAGLRRLALAAGAVTYVEKGASLEEVVTALRGALWNRGDGQNDERPTTNDEGLLRKPNDP